MKIQAREIRKGAIGVAAGKIALLPATSSAALGKVDQTGSGGVPPISLDQIGYPLDLLSPPVAELTSGGSDAAMGKVDSSGDPSIGVIYQGEQQYAASNGVKPRIDFIVNGIRNDVDMHLLLVFSTSKPLDNPERVWEKSRTGQISLDPSNLKIIEWIITKPVDQLPTPGDLSPSVLGTTPARNSSAVTIPFEIGNLTAEELKNGIWFQAAAVPLDESGNFNFAESQATEVDHFVIDYVSSGDTGTKGDIANPEPESGGKGGSSGGSSSSGGK